MLLRTVLRLMLRIEPKAVTKVPDDPLRQSVSPTSFNQASSLAHEGHSTPGAQHTSTAQTITLETGWTTKLH